MKDCMRAPSFILAFQNVLIEMLMKKTNSLPAYADLKLIDIHSSLLPPNTPISLSVEPKCCPQIVCS
jgi:hypothetical protein